MATPRKITLSVRDKKSDATIEAGATASANVIVEYDKDEPSVDIIVALEKVKQLILEEEY